MNKISYIRLNVYHAVWVRDTAYYLAMKWYSSCYEAVLWHFPKDA